MDAISYSRALKPDSNNAQKSLAENAFRRLDEHDISRKVSGVFRSIIMVI